MLFAVVSCSTYDAVDGPGALDAAEQRRAQLASLAAIYYRDTPLPPPPTAAELALLAAILAAAPDEEQNALEALYRSENDLLVYATRDSDRDGVRDYRISDYYGKFLEGDIDVDGDGVRNVLDVSPYDAKVGGRDRNGDGIPDEGFADSNQNGVPDHLDWRSDGKPAEQAARQEALLRDHRIILVERSTPFTETLSRAVYDALTRVFHHALSERRPLPTLRTIAAEESCLLTPAVDDGTQAMAVAQTQSLIIYRVGIEQPPLVQLGLVVHELGHSYQFSLDFDEANLAGENGRVYFPAPEFHSLVEPFGWDAQPLPFDPDSDAYQIFTPQYYELTPTYTWLGDTPETWAVWLKQQYLSNGESYLDAPAARAYHIVGEYSLTNPWEWYSDNLLAYTLLAIEQRFVDCLAVAELTDARETMQATIATAWPGFQYRNFDALALEPHFGQRFPLRREDSDFLVTRYVLPLVQTP
jgi:hypothetical protein